MRKKHIAPDHDSVNDVKIHREKFGPDVKLNSPKFRDGDMVEYRFSQDPETWKPAIINNGRQHNSLGHVIYKIFSTMYGYREVHESVLYPMEGIEYIPPDPEPVEQISSETESDESPEA